MRICTSLSPKRVNRQQFCIKSWMDLGIHVTAIQSVGEVKSYGMDQLYPDITFIETNLVGDLFNRRNMVRLSAMLQQATKESIIILNSDIEIRSTKEEFFNNWSPPEPKTLKIGIRWDEDPVTKELKLLKWGIDAFLITPQITKHLTDIGMTIGCPAWDYWIPIHLNKLGYKIQTSKVQELIHEDHPKNWSQVDYRIGVSLLTRHYNLSAKSASLLVQELTERTFL